MHTILVVVHLFLALGIIGLVLMQHGKGADAGAAFGSGASGTVFGSRGSANFLSRSTGILATFFFLTSLALAWYAMKATDRGGLMDKVEIAPPPALVNPNSAVPAIPGVTPAVEAPKSAVPAIPESKPADAPAVQVEAPAQSAPAVEQAAAMPAAAPQAEQAEPQATTPPEAPAVPAASGATEQVPAKAE